MPKRFDNRRAVIDLCAQHDRVYFVAQTKLVLYRGNWHEQQTAIQFCNTRVENPDDVEHHRRDTTPLG